MEERVAERTVVLEQARIALERMALYDSLTGLANRTLLGDRIRQAIARMDRGARPPCVLVLDLDEFKTINDGLGHGAGDRILTDVAQRLTSVVRETDTVARLGGDEFAILMPDTAELDATRVAERALKELHSPFTVVRQGGLGGGQHRALFRAAAARAPTICCGTRTPRCMPQKPRAAAISRSSGRRCIRPRRNDCMSDPNSAPRSRRANWSCTTSRSSSSPAGRSSAQRRWSGGRTRSVACCCRLDFVPVAEESGHIIELGRWVVQAAIAQLRMWCLQFPAVPFQLNVNLAPVEVRWPGMAEFIREVLDLHGVEPSKLALEISETGLMTGDSVGLEALRTLRRLGVGVEIDDFGTGYSSISYLRRLPIDTVKVDQSLITDIASDGQQVTFVSAILRLIESVGLRTVVEGIETVEQRDQLCRLGCLYGQGHYFSRAGSRRSTDRTAAPAVRRRAGGKRRGGGLSGSAGPSRWGILHVAR